MKIATRFVLEELYRANRKRCDAIRVIQLDFASLFNDLAEELGITRKALAALMGWSPVPRGGNKIMRGEAEPSESDCMNLMNIYLARAIYERSPRST